jgi:agmatinase
MTRRPPLPPLPEQCPGFLDPPEAQSTYARSRFVVLQLPYDATCTYGVGCRYGPAAIVAASSQVEWYDEELGFEPCEAGICTLRPVEPIVSRPDAYHAAVRKVAETVVGEGKIPVGLGGEHSVTWGLYQAVRQREAAFTVLHVDAHLDLRSTWQGSRASHACILRRIADDGAPTVHVGVRSGPREEWEFASTRGLAVFPGREIVRQPDESWIPKVVEAIRTPEVYVTVDVDGFDPSVIPGTGTPEPGGLGFWQGMALLRAVAGERRVIGFDVVELEPRADSHVSDFAAAKVVYKLMGYSLLGPGEAEVVQAGRRDFATCLGIRIEVFVRGQGVAAADEQDGEDPHCTHFLARLAGLAVGTGRLRVTPEGEAKAERVAVRVPWRGRGIGQALMEAIEAEAAKRGFERIVLHAQVPVAPFYERLGYHATGGAYMEAGLPHRPMEKKLSLSSGS